MEVYVLDSLLRRIQVFDKFESLIWTERFSEVGDFELDLKSTLENRSAFMNGTRIAINESYRVMTVDSVEDSTDNEGREMLKVKGHSLEDILNDRVATDSITDLTPWYLVGTPGDIARTMFNDVCVLGTVNARDVIPFIMPGSIFPPDTIPETTTEIEWLQSPDALKNAIKSICDLYDLGFRLVRNFDTSQLYFDIYSGNDRTSRQTDVKPVIFAVNLDNLQNTTEFSTTENAKNVAYVFSDAGFQIVYGDNIDPNIDGFERRVLGVNASDITLDNPDPVGALIQRGTEELNKSRGLKLFDGEINQYSEYKYGVDYELGDIVEMRNKDGIITYQRVTEQIFVSDQEGERSYPTLSIDLITGTDTWLSWTNNDTAWIDYDYFTYIYCGWDGTNDLVKLGPGVSIESQHGLPYAWAPGAGDERALLGPDGLTRNANTWFDPGYVEAQLRFTDPWTGFVRLYAVDYDSHIRRETITITDSTGAQVQALSTDFNGGVWLSFPIQVNAGGLLTIRVDNNAGTTNAVLAGIFLDDGNEANAWVDM